MISLTMIARVADGLLLAASMQDNDQVGVKAELHSEIATFYHREFVRSNTDVLKHDFDS